jgi:hypothetical protein
MEGQMKTRCLVFVISILFIIGSSGNIQAVSDSTGEQMGPLDLATASVVTYDKPSPAETPDFAKIGVTMAPGSHLPAVIFFDFDVDNDTATGTASIITGIPAFNCGGQPCKTPVGNGFDFFVVLALRTQGVNSNLSLCSGCSEPRPQCTTRGAPNDCNEGICYELGSHCHIGDPNCYEISIACTSCSGGSSYYPLDNVCGTTTASCDKPLIKGEYYVGFGQPPAVKVGDINIRNSYDINNENEICVTLPWGLIVTQLWSAINDAADPNHLPFDISYTVDNPPKYQVSVFYDPVFADENDVFTAPGITIDVNDWLPDTDRVADGDFNGGPPCSHNSAGGYGDQSVAADDVSDFLNEFGRNIYCLGCGGGCPNCKK